jgi:hypothetical protein
MELIESDASSVYIVSFGNAGAVIVKAASNPCGALFTAFVYG